MNHRMLLLIGGLGLSSCALADCDHRAERDLQIDAATLQTLELDARAGDLAVRGEAGLQQVVVRGIACASDAERLSAIQLRHRTDGDRLIVAVELPEADSGWFGSSTQRLDLEIRVPARLHLELSDSSGDTSVRGVASATVRDSSGDLELHDIAGDLSVTDSSGDIEVRGLGGNLDIPNDSSGDIEVVGVGGNVHVQRDSSGDIELREVRGDARVDTDSSGEIRFRNVDGSALVGNDSSGSISARDIGRDFRVDTDTSGGITHDNVGGTVTLPQD